MKGLTLNLPPLRERKIDLPLLVHHFVNAYGQEHDVKLKIPDGALDCLFNYDWPGNVRQLENTIERSVALELSEVLHVELPVERAKAHGMAAVANGNGTTSNGEMQIPADGLDMERHVAALERSILLSALKQSNGVQTRAAEMLKLS